MIDFKQLPLIERAPEQTMYKLDRTPGPMPPLVTAGPGVEVSFFFRCVKCKTKHERPFESGLTFDKDWNFLGCKVCRGS